MRGLAQKTLQAEGWGEYSTLGHTDTQTDGHTHRIWSSKAFVKPSPPPSPKAKLRFSVVTSQEIVLWAQLIVSTIRLNGPATATFSH